MNNTRFALCRHREPGIFWVAMLLLAVGLNPPVAAGEGLSLSPPFSIQTRDGICWLANPQGQCFFSLGVCCVNQGHSPSEYSPANPAYGAWRYYADSNQWADTTIKRLKAWGFSTLGGWSDFPTLRRCPDGDIAFAPVLHIGTTAGAPWWDMWDPRVIQRMDQAAAEQILPLRDDPRVIGYYSDNEIGWWNAILFKMTLEQAPTSGQRQRLLELLRQTYHNEWTELLQDFETAPDVRDWAELERHGVLFLRPGARGIHVERRFLSILAERYYSLVHELIRKYDRRALFLGDRYPSFYYPEVARVAGRYVDAISLNLNANWNDGHFARFPLETLHRLTGKPVIIGEFYLAAAENRSGNRNNHGVFPVVSTQRERANGFRNTLQRLLSTPYVIGADWFQYYDEPTHGRFDGENYNFGLVDIHDHPYEVLTKMVSSFDLADLKRLPAGARPDATQGVPLAPRDPLGQFEPNRALKLWDREHGFVSPVTEFPLADLYICWNKKAVFLGLYAQDVVEDVFYRGKTVPAGDRATWTVTTGKSTEPIRAILGAGREPIVDHPAVRVINLSGLNNTVRNIAGMELPARVFGKNRFKAGDTIEIASTFLTHCGAYVVEWKGQFRLGME